MFVRTLPLAVAIAAALGSFNTIRAADLSTKLVHSVKSGNWSAATTWENGHLPAAGESVQIRPQDRVLYDISTTAAFHMVHVAGTLTFATNRDTHLDVGLLLIHATEPDMDTCTAHLKKTAPDHAKDEKVAATPLDESSASLEIGTPESPLPATHHALIRLTPHTVTIWILPRTRRPRHVSRLNPPTCN